MKQPPDDWASKLRAIQLLPSVTWAGKEASFSAPEPGTFFATQGRRFLVTRSRGVDGVVLGVASHRASCLIAVELPGGAALLVVADSPAVLETVAKEVFAVLGREAFAL